MTYALRVRDLVKKFADHIAVQNLSFEVPCGVVYGILGPNGAGKSTTLRMINDIIAPDAGTIALLDGLAPGRRAAQRIGYLPEERGLYPHMRVTELLAWMGELRGLPRGVARERAATWLDRLGLAAWGRNRVKELSKGMQQKLQFATAVLHDPELVILDEPWSGLDPINAEVLRDIVDELRLRGRTVVFSTHQMEQAEKLVDEVCIIARGRNVLDGSLVEVKRREASDRVISLTFVDAAAHAAGLKVLADPGLVLEQHVPQVDYRTDCQVKLVEGVAPQRLLAALVRADAGIRRFAVVVPTLHQIFVNKVGETATVAERRADAP